MTDMQAAPIAGTAPLSTSIDQGGAPLGTGGGAPNLSEPKVAETPKVDAKPESAGDTLKGELARIKADEAKDTRAKAEEAANAAKLKADDTEKTDKSAKPVVEDGKIAKAPTEGDKPDVEATADKGEPEKAATERAETDKRQSEGQKYHEPPARFLPKAKEVWANVPHAVKGEIARLTQEHEAEVTKYREAGERYEPLRQFDEMAKSSGTDLKTALTSYTNIENMLRSNPVQGIAEVLRNIGLTPQQYAQHVMQNPQAHDQALRQSPQQQPQQQRQSDPEVAALKEELQSMRQEQTVQSIIAPFAKDNPRYYELEGDIAFFLTSGKIPASLTPQEKLEAAYDMAVRINPTSSVTSSQAPETLAVAKPAPSDPAGSKSIRGAPNGQDPDDDDPDATDIRTLLRREMRKAS